MYACTINDLYMLSHDFNFMYFMYVQYIYTFYQPSLLGRYYIYVCMHAIGKMFPSQQCGDVRVGDRLDTAGDKNVKNSSISEWISQLHRNMNNRRWSSLVSVLTIVHLRNV